MFAAFLVAAACLLPQDVAAGSPSVAGIYQGELAVAGQTLRIAIHLDQREDGTWSAAMDSIDQGAMGIKASKVAVTPPDATIEWSSMGAKLVGSVTADGQTFDGTYTQGPFSAPLTLSRVESVEAPKRPQVPQPPFPYTAVDVDFDSVDEDVELAGTLTVPEGKGPFPAVVLVSGSGAQNRDEELMGHKPFLVIADHLSRNGIAVLRYDDRGTAQSTGNHGAATSFDFANDAEGAVRFLKTRAEIDPARIGIAGHSEGGLIAPIVAARSSDVAFIVMLAGPGIPGDEILRLQNDLIARAGGATEEQLTRSKEINEKIFAALKEEELGPRLSGKLLAIIEDAKRAATTDAERVEYEQAALGIGQFATPWFKAFLAYDPVPTLRAVKCPVLALNGGKDLQVPPKENLEAIERALREGGNTRFVIRELPGLNHLFQPTETGAPSEYVKIETTFSEDALTAMTEWVLALK